MFVEVLRHSIALQALKSKYDDRKSRCLEHLHPLELTLVNDVHLIECVIPLLLIFLCHRDDLPLIVSLFSGFQSEPSTSHIFLTATNSPVIIATTLRMIAPSTVWLFTTILKAIAFCTDRKPMLRYIRALSTERNPKHRRSYISAHMSSQYPTMTQYITKMGYVHIYDARKTNCNYLNSVSSTIPIAIEPHDGSGEIIGINGVGHVLIMSDSAIAILAYMRQTIEIDNLVHVILSSNGLISIVSWFTNEIEIALQSEAPKRTAKLATVLPSCFLQTADTIDQFRKMSTGYAGLSTVLFYFHTCLDREAVIKWIVFNGKPSATVEETIISGKKDQRDRG